MPISSNLDGGSRATSAAMTLAVVLLLSTLGGYKLDQWLGTQPIFLAVGVMLGAALGFIHLLQQLAPKMLPWNHKATAKPSDNGNDSGTVDD